MRRYLIAGNWKMHGSLASVKELAEKIQDGSYHYDNVDLLVLPSFIHLLQVARLLDSNPNISFGAQNLYLGEQGAYTGEVSATMLKDIGCSYVLVGHSERRQIFHEVDQLVAEKFLAAINANLTPILCVGETQQEREANQTELVIQRQLEAVIQIAGIDAFHSAVIAYEPVWAIGTGLTATPEQAQNVHTYIRKLLAQNNVDIASTIRILYGGSMKPDNAASLLTMPDIDGGLIGGASLNAESFLKICAAANDSATSPGNKMCKIG